MLRADSSRTGERKEVTVLIADVAGSLDPTFAVGGQSSHAVNHGAGPGTFSYQVWYRSLPMSFCDPAAGFNLSNGYDLTW